MLPAYERMLKDDLFHYRQLNNADLFFSEYIEMKHFCSLKVIELSLVTRREETLLKIVQLLEKILQNEEVINFEQSLNEFVSIVYFDQIKNWLLEFHLLTEEFHVTQFFSKKV